MSKDLNSTESMPEKQLEKKLQRLELINEMEFVNPSLKNSNSPILFKEYIQEQINSLKLSDDNKKIVENLLSDVDLKKSFVKNTEYETPVDKSKLLPYLQEKIDNLPLSDENKKIVENLLSDLDLKKSFVIKNTEYAEPSEKGSNEVVFSNTYEQTKQTNNLQISDETKKILDKLIEKKPLIKNKI